jgi:putative peptidoglycan lipid II flippase
MRSALKQYIPSGSAVLMGTTMASYVLGLLRDRMLAQRFGASVALDSYNAAFLIPDFSFNLLVASGIAAAAVPLFTQLYARSHEDAHRYMNSLFVSAVGVMAVIAIGLGVLATQLSILVAPGFDDAGRALVVHMMRILAVSALFFAASNALGALLVSQRRFFAYGISPVVYNVGIIIGVLYFAPRFGIIGVAYGTVLGAFLHFIVRFMGGMHSGWRLQFILRPWEMAEMRRTITLMVPKMVGHPIEMLTFWVFTFFASWLAQGSVTVVNFARNFQSVPVSLIGIAVSTAAFPLLSRAVLSPRGELKPLFRRMSATILTASTVAAILLFVVRYPLISTLLGGGAFDADAIATTAIVLGVFCFAIPTESLSHIFARSFYATQNTITPVIMGVVGLIVSSGAAFVLLNTYGIIGIPMGFFFGSFVKSLSLYILFERKLSQQR